MCSKTLIGTFLNQILSEIFGHLEVRAKFGNPNYDKT